MSSRTTHTISVLSQYVEDAGKETHLSFPTHTNRPTTRSFPATHIHLTHRIQPAPAQSKLHKQPNLSPTKPSKMPNNSYHTSTPRMLAHHHSPHQPPGHNLRYQAQHNGIQNSFHAHWYPGHSSYQPADPTITTPAKHQHPGAPTRGTQKTACLASDHLVPGPEAEGFAPAVDEVFELPARGSFTGVRVCELEARSEHGSALGLAGDVSEYTTYARAVSHASNHSSLAGEFGYLAGLITSSSSSHFVSPPARQAEMEDFMYLGEWVGCGLPTPLSALGTPFTPVEAASVSPSPSSSSATPATSPHTTPTPSPPPLPPKPRTYQIQSPIKYEAGGEAGERGAGL